MDEQRIQRIVRSSHLAAEEIASDRDVRCKVMQEFPPLYSIEEHKHRFAAWAASRAASVKDHRFSVVCGKRLLESAGLNGFRRTDDLPSPAGFDIEHTKWRASIIEVGRKDLNITHGIAAKLINVYLKSLFVCGGYHDHPNVKTIHPPIDSILLDELHRRRFGKRTDWRRKPWSKLDSSEYEDLISKIRKAVAMEMPNAGLWQIEEFWKP